MSGYALSRFVRLDADGGVVTPGLVDPHTHLLFAGIPRGRARPAPAGCRVPGHPRRGRRDPLDGGGDARGHARGARRSTAGAGWTRCAATASPRWRRSPATAWTSRPSCGSGGRVPAGQGGPGRRGADVSWAPTPSRPSTAPGPTAPRPTSGTSSRSSCRGSRPRVGRARATSSASRACSPRTRAGASSQAAAAYGHGDPPPRRRAGPLGWRGAGRGARRPVRGPPPRPVGRGARRPGRGRGGRAPDGGDAAARHDLVPHGRRGRARPAGSSTRASRSRWARTSIPAPRPRPACRW